MKSFVRFVVGLVGFFVIYLLVRGFFPALAGTAFFAGTHAVSWALVVFVSFAVFVIWAFKKGR